MNGKRRSAKPYSSIKKNNKSKKKKFFFIDKIFILILILGVLSFILVRMFYLYRSPRVNNNYDYTYPKPTYIYVSPTKYMPYKPIPSVKEGYQQYKNEYLRYGFSYQKNDSLYKCPDIQCLHESRMTLRVETLTSSQVLTNDLKSTLLKTDLFCSAVGPGGSIICENQKIVDFKNSLGTNGYKILRKKIVEGSGGGISPGIYQDYAYVFLLTETKKGPGYLDYAAVIIEVDNPAQSNLNDLDVIANTLFIY